MKKITASVGTELRSLKRLAVGPLAQSTSSVWHKVEQGLGSWYVLVNTVNGR